MSFLLNFGELLLLVLVSVDTLGFIAQNRKNPSNSDSKDYLRLCFTWVFFLVIRSLICSSCGGFIGNALYFAAFLAKVYISIPALGGALKLYSVIVEQNALKHYGECAVNMIKAKMNGGEPVANKKSE